MQCDVLKATAEFKKNGPGSLSNGAMLKMGSQSVVSKLREVTLERYKQAGRPDYRSQILNLIIYVRERENLS